MKGGYHFRYLDIDLDAGSASIGEPDPELLKKFIGGKGLGLALLCDLDRSDDPLDPENPMIFLAGPLTGTAITTSNRSCVVTRSPLTRGFLDSHAGGHFGTALRGAGYDYIIIRGKSESPVYIKVNPEGVEMHDASDLWGSGCYRTEDILRERHPGSIAASIGPAGENLVKFACISTDKYRQFGRGGAGAVMGSKNLKAIVLEGRESVPLHDNARFRELAVQMTKETIAHPNRKKRYELGTPMWVRMGQETGGFLPTHNFKYGTWKDYESLTSETMKKELEWKSCGCYNCVIQCSKRVTYDGGDFEGPEYETAAYLGSGCELADAKALASANSLCDDLGLDSISCGVTISFAMEAAEKGLLSPEDNEWIRFGSAGAVLELINKIARREGIGDMLAEGTRIASSRIGKDSGYFAIQVAGMELSGVNPLGCYSMALALTTSDFASHTRLWTATDEMNGNLELEKLIPYIAGGQDDVNVRNSIIVCDFLMFGLDRLAPMVEAATGHPYTKDELLLVGERIHSLARLYNLRTGRTHADDILPGRFHGEESCSGLMRGRKIPREMFERHLQEYFAHRGWDREGRPTVETLERLGLVQYL
jgi:aldehyde:ferredoxin oxidoreductase